MIKSVELANISENYSFTNTKWYDTSNNTQSIFSSNSSKPGTNYINNPIYQELPSKAEYYGKVSDKQIYIDLRAA